MSSKLDLEIRRGDTFYKTFTIKQPDGTPVDITGVSIRAQLRKYVNSTIVVDLTTNILDASAGRWSLGLTPDETANIDFHYGKYDVEFTFVGGKRQTIIFGNILISEDITRG